MTAAVIMDTGSNIQLQCLPQMIHSSVLVRTKASWSGDEWIISGSLSIQLFRRIPVAAFYLVRNLNLSALLKSTMKFKMCRSKRAFYSICTSRQDNKRLFAPSSANLIQRNSPQTPCHAILWWNFKQNMRMGAGSQFARYTLYPMVSRIPGLPCLCEHIHTVQYR